MERVCHTCAKDLKDAPAILVSGTCYCYYHAKQSYPIVLKRWEDNKHRAMSNYRSEMEAYLSRQSQAHAAKLEYDQSSCPGVLRVFDNQAFMTVVCMSTIAFSLWFTKWIASWLVPQIQGTPFLVGILFVLVIVGGGIALGVGCVCLITSASQDAISEARKKYAAIYPEPAPFTEQPPVFQAPGNLSELLRADEDNDNPLQPAGSGYDRNAILRRDRFQCQCCGKTFQPDLLEVHHVTPRARGGGDAKTNLVTLCLKCHLIEDWFGHVHKQRREFGL